ncbi:MAG: glycosyltransferase [Candidatus Nealsonbacteria bacterium]
MEANNKNLKKIKILHIGNIAGNGYNNAKFLRRKGIESDLLIYNYTYAMGQPEWEDAYFEEEVGLWKQDWNKINLHGFERPEWVYQYSSVPPKKIKLISHFKDILDMRKITNKEFNLQFKKNNLISNIEILKQKIGNNILQARSILKIVRSFRGLFFYINHIKEIIDRYDIIQAYGEDPIIAMLACPDKPLVSFEHGTMRDTPLEKTLKGELLKLAYQKSRKCIITNPDGIFSAKKIGLNNYVFIPHPVDTDKFFPKETYLRKELKRKTNLELIFFAPARHDWEVKCNYKIIKAFNQYLKKSSLKTILIFSDWGEDLEKSKKYIKKLGIEKHIIWTYPLPKMKLAQYYNASDLVIDQFRYGHFGTTSPEAMACGKPVINQFDWEINKWAWQEKPPIVPAESSFEIFKAMEQLSKDKNLRQELGKKGRNWMEKHHNWELVAQKQIDIYQEILKT